MSTKKSYNPVKKKDETSLKKSPPWFTYLSKIKAIFGPDPDIEIDYDEDKYEIKLYVTGASKAEAISELLPEEIDFGGVKLHNTVLVANKAENTNLNRFIEAFSGNPVFKYSVAGELFGKPIGYMVFEKEVVQFYDDNLQDLHGVQSTLYEDIARDIFESSSKGVFFCTDVPEVDEDTESCEDI